MVEMRDEIFNCKIVINFIKFVKKNFKPFFESFNEIISEINNLRYK